jgi:CBS domain-containing protein
MNKKNLYSVSPNDPLEKAIDILSQHHFKKIPVINGSGQLVGVISRGDVIRQLSKMFILKQD